MDNENSPQPNNTPNAVSNNTPGQDIPPVPTISAQPPAPVRQPGAAQTAPVKKPHNYAFLGLGVLILLAIFLPNSSAAQALAYPIIILGAIAGIKFFIDSIRSSRRVNNVLAKSFVVFGGLGVGVVIFIVCLIAGAIVGFAKDPHPQSTG